MVKVALAPSDSLAISNRPQTVRSDDRTLHSLPPYTPTCIMAQ